MFGFIAFVLWIVASTSSALPAGKSALCQAYGNLASCTASGAAACGACHSTPPELSPFGKCVKQHLPKSPMEPSKRFEDAVKALGQGDCDKNGEHDHAQLLRAEVPGNKVTNPDTQLPSSCEGECAINPEFTFRRILIDFCGRSPTLDEINEFQFMPRLTQLDELDRMLEKCRSSENWIGKDGVLWQMAHDKIRPLKVIKSGEDGGAVPLGDYYDDYAYFVYHHTGGRDVRKILTGQYFVKRNTDPTSYEEVEHAPLHPRAGGPIVGVLGIAANGTQQFVYKSHRAGLLTTLWFAASNTMFTAIPRTAASNAVRAWLGIDIAKGQGLEHAPPQEKVAVIDYDVRGVTQPACIGCHQLLDPMSYPFSRYNGLNFDGLFERFEEIRDFVLASKTPETALSDFVRSKPGVLVPGFYQPERIAMLAEKEASTAPLLSKTPESGWLLGVPVKNVVEWAAVAVNSELFAQTIARDYWHYLIGPSVKPEHQAIFDAAWRSLMTTHAYDVEKMVREIVRSEAYARP